MSIFSKHMILIAACATMVIGAMATAQAQTMRPAPDRCISLDKIGQVLIGASQRAGYVSIYHSPQPVSGPVKTFFGVKNGNRWFAFTFDTCKYKIVSEGRLKSGMPAFLEGMSTINR
jgi:hypothetical protein